MKKFTKILPGLFVCFVFLFNFEVKAQNLSELIGTYKTSLSFANAQYDELIIDIATFAENKSENMSDNNLWLVDREQYPQANDADFYPKENWFNLDDFEIKYDVGASNKFMPFVEKKVVSADSKIIFVGDLHANVNSLLSIFEDLKNLEYLDENYKNINPNNYYVFLGDYVDRGQHDFQVLSLLIKFYNENSKNVFLLRGNHEDYLHHSSGDILKKLFNDSMNFDIAFDFLEDDCSEIPPNKYKELFNKIHCLFEYLPVALYLGCQDDNGVTNFLQCCHGGIEIGYDPLFLMENNGSKFQRILGLNRKKSLGKKVTEFNKHMAKYIEKTNILTLFDFGFCWTDFLFDIDDCDLCVNPNRGALFGKRLTKHYLNYSSSDNFELRGIIRGHQHGCQLLTNLFKNYGCLKSWDGLVYTLLSTNLGICDAPKEFDWSGSSFNILEMNNNKDDWMMHHFYRTTTDACESKKFLFFGPGY